MSERRELPAGNAGAFIGPDITVVVPSSLLDEGPVPEEGAPEEGAPEEGAPEDDAGSTAAPRRGPLRRILDRLTGADRGHRPPG
jgi:hypothetical protein